MEAYREKVVVLNNEWDSFQGRFPLTEFQCQRRLGQNIDGFGGFSVSMFAPFENEHYLLQYLEEVQTIGNLYWNRG